MPPVQEKWIRGTRGERPQGVVESTSSAPHLASSSAASFPRRNECPGTNSSLIEQEREKTVPARSATEFEITGKMEERRELESDTRREEKWQTFGAVETSKKHAEWRRLQRKNLNILGLLKRKEWPQYHRESSWQERRSCPCQKEQEQSRLSKAPDHEGGESQGGRELHLAKAYSKKEREGKQQEPP